MKVKETKAGTFVLVCSFVFSLGRRYPHAWWDFSPPLNLTDILEVRLVGGSKPSLVASSSGHIKVPATASVMCVRVS